jgi:hypothetical protein
MFFLLVRFIEALILYGLFRIFSVTLLMIIHLFICLSIIIIISKRSLIARNIVYFSIKDILPNVLFLLLVAPLLSHVFLFFA